MKKRLYSAQNAQYVAGEWMGEDTSGIQPIGDHVLILPDKAAEKVGKESSILVPEEIQERHSMAAETGLLVAMGAGAFKWSGDRATPFEGEVPQIGDRVLFTRYSGQEMIGRDGQRYRCMADNAIGGKWLPQPEPVIGIGEAA